MKSSSDLDFPDLFAVVTWGCAGTKWLSMVLNGHPEVCCVHSLRNCLRASGAVEASDGSLFSIVEHMGLGYRLAGDVHGIARTSVPELRAKYGERFRCVGLVRQPGPRLMSHLALYDNYGYSRTLWANMKYVRSLPGFRAIAHHANTQERLMVVHAINMLNTIVEELSLFRVFRVEDLAARPQSLRDLVLELSGGAVDADEQFLAWGQSIHSTNSHRRGRRAELEPWHVEVIRAIVRPEAIAAYRSIGYDVPDSWQSDDAARRKAA